MMFSTFHIFVGHLDVLCEMSVQVVCALSLFFWSLLFTCRHFYYILYITLVLQISFPIMWLFFLESQL